MANEAPERIWLSEQPSYWKDNIRTVFLFGNGSHKTEYIRADLATLSSDAVAGGEEVQPVALAHVRLEDDGLEADLEVLDGSQMQVKNSPVNLYLAPPTAELGAENARLTKERDDFKDEWQAELEKRMEVQARLRATEARLAETMISLKARVAELEKALDGLFSAERFSLHVVYENGNYVYADVIRVDDDEFRTARRVREGGKVDG